MKAFVENRKHRDKGSSALVHSGRRRVEAMMGNLGQTASRRSEVARERSHVSHRGRTQHCVNNAVCLIRATDRPLDRALQDMTLN